MDERHAAIRNLPSLTPATPADLAAALREASAAGRPVVPLGAGAHQHLGAPPPAGALHIGTVALNQVLEYAPADLTATAQAGVTLAALQQELARHGQWLPWDPPGGERATLGGLLAAALSGPLRLGYGAPRDWVLGMRVALGDGRIVKSGGRVVKNVAGYDAHKLHIGALGTLGVILDVTFKLAPLPERMATLAWACPDLQAALTLARALRERPLAPVSLALLARPAAPTTSDQRPA
ncbi:MAG TPA: FAD-binding oxidoreductase, partial [Alphaproteobacteria bacterium]|nr:FAD-binding oxidoreductase [Alphaproteobacteria bacterium]